MVNQATIKCPHCKKKNSDVFALFATNEGTKVQLRCLECRKQYDIKADSEDVDEWGKYFKQDKVNEVTK